jgi:hypothetical protein
MVEPGTCCRPVPARHPGTVSYTGRPEQAYLPACARPVIWVRDGYFGQGIGSSSLWAAPGIGQAKNILDRRPHQFRVGTLRMPEKESGRDVTSNAVRSPFEHREAWDCLRLAIRGWKISALARKDDHLVWLVLLDKALKATLRPTELFRRARVVALGSAANTIR